MTTSIYQQLAQYLPEEQADSALLLWEMDYSHKQTGGLIGFLNELDQRFSLGTKNKQMLLMALYQVLPGMAKKPASPAPAAAADARAAAGADRTGLDGPEAVVFVEFCQHLVTDAQRLGFKEFGYFNDALVEALAQTAVPHATRKNLANWVLHRAELDKSTVPKGQLADLVSAFYTALCEAAGPVIANSILSQATDAVSRLPEARLFPPQRLL